MHHRYHDGARESETTRFKPFRFCRPIPYLVNRVTTGRFAPVLRPSRKIVHRHLRVSSKFPRVSTYLLHLSLFIVIRRVHTVCLLKNNELFDETFRHAERRISREILAQKRKRDDVTDNVTRGLHIFLFSREVGKSTFLFTLSAWPSFSFCAFDFS